MSAPAELAPKKPETDSAIELAAEKYNVCWRIAVDQYGANLHAMGELLHTSLFEPTSVNGHAGPGFEERFPERYSILTAEIPAAQAPPEKEDFIYAITNAANYRVDSASCLYPGVIDEVTKLMRRGRVVIWTAGDTTGTTEHPGSMAQYAKLAMTGLGRARTEIARETGRSRLETLTVISAEDKLSDQTVERVNELVDGHPAFVMDDRLKNLSGLVARLPNVIPIWVQQDRHGRTIPPEFADFEMEDLQERYNAVGDFPSASQKAEVLLELDTERPVYLVDYDGTLSNASMRGQLQQQAVLGSIRSRGWL